MAFDFFVMDNDGNLAQSPILVHATATTASDGTFSVDLTNTGLTHIYNVHASVLAPNNTLANAANVSVSSFSITSVSGIAYQPTTAVLGLLGVNAVGAGRTVYVTIIGDQA